MESVILFVSASLSCVRDQRTTEQYLFIRLGPETEMAMRKTLIRLVHAYERVQVELQGKYSLERLFSLHSYQLANSFWACMLVVLLTPLPCLIIITLADLIPLNPPSAGLAHSHVFWARAIVVVVFISLTLLNQARRFVPGLPCSTWFLCVMSVLVTVGATTNVVLLAYWIGFPLPFTLICGSPCWCVLYGMIVFFKWGPQLRGSAQLRKELFSYIKIVVVQLSLTVVYPAFIFAFNKLDGWEQTAFALCLPLIKLLAKNALSIAIDSSNEDMKPEGVIFNVEVFHALYMSCCMQSSRSLVTTGMLMALDFMHASSSLLDINSLLRTIRALEAKLALSDDADDIRMANMFPDDKLSLIEKAMYYALHDSLVRSDASIRVSGLKTHHSSAHAVFPTTLTAEPSKQSKLAAQPSEPLCGPQPVQKLPEPRAASTASATQLGGPQGATRLFGKLSTHKRRKLGVLSTEERILYVSSILQVLHIAEFVILIEFVEVVIPVIYCVYLSAMFYLPNRVYYPQLAGMDTHSLLSTIGNVLTYAGLEFVSFIAVGVALHRKLQISTVHQLAFVLHTQWQLVQSKMVLWVVFAVQVSLEHFGYDYSFQFAWLRQP